MHSTACRFRAGISCRENEPTERVTEEGSKWEFRSGGERKSPGTRQIDRLVAQHSIAR